MPLPTSLIYSNLVSLHILDNLCDTCRDDGGNQMYVLASLINLCSRLRELGLRCGHHEREATMDCLIRLSLVVPSFAMFGPVLMPDPGVAFHAGVRSLLIYGPTFRCPAIDHHIFPCVEEVTVKGWVDDCPWAPSLLFPPLGTGNRLVIILIP
ncbi:hypothetical protein M407DRAFT_176861 [Tulasnella calospora MUT 4182]|uniref:Uncharacterized protein n=1 Tax=Tulasnella calospora MUT 4182 TaxID=1051891 RepID=A0A0C3M573_9AGAM|nr:hypothetical protein M407DRAFT_176861 [Tulasnella calospora MUT 4182]